MNPFEVISVSANGLTHRVHLSGPADGSVAILLHGYMDAAGTWDLLGPSLADAGLRVVAPDMRGFGEGPRAPAGSYYHFADYVFDVADIVDALSPEEPVMLVGHSMGGTIATLFAGSFPERVSRFANLEGLGPLDNAFDQSPARMRRWIDDVRSLRARGETKPVFDEAEATKRLAINHPNIDLGLLTTRLPHLATKTPEGKLAWRFDPLHRTTSPMPFFSGLFCAYARKVACPVHFVSGGPTGYHPPDEEERLAAFGELSRSEIADAGHMMHWTRPRELAAVLRSFLVGA